MMRKLMIFLVAFLLPLSALEMSADEKGTIRPIPLIKVEPKNGAPVTYIYKTFDLDYDVDHDVFYH